MKNVILIPGFGGSDLGILETGEIIWWDSETFLLKHFGVMRLDGGGGSPGPPDGKALGVRLKPQPYWKSILDSLTSQLDVGTWKVLVSPYDWRYDLQITASEFARSIRLNTTPAEPVTIVGHSQGGLIAVLVWADLNSTGQANLVRRIITVASPFDGAYWPVTWQTGLAASIFQMQALYPVASRLSGFNGLFLSLNYLVNVALTWPCLYWLYPSLLGIEATVDPNRKLLYTSLNYPNVVAPPQQKLDDAKYIFQPLLASNATTPPPWVLTCVASRGLETPNTLRTSDTPLDLGALGTTIDGDSIVGYPSQIKPGCKLVSVSGDHNSLPGGITGSGLLADLIRDPRGPLYPPPLPEVVSLPLPIDVTSSPESDYVSTLRCISGG